MKYLKTYNESLEDKKITCGIYLFDANNLLLIQHPTNFRPTVWGVPKGRPDIGEDNLFEVAKRELFEETGIVLDDYTIVHQEEFNEVRYNDSNKYLKGFFVKIEEDLSDFNLYCDSMVYRNGKPSFPEVDEWKWVTIEEAKEIFSSDRMTNFQVSNLDMCRDLLSLNESSSFEMDDFDTMSRYQLFEADTTMAFDFNREFITDSESIKDLIEKYNEFYVKEDSWSGGPSPRGFIEYFNKNYSKKGTASIKTFYPTIDLMIETPDYGTLIVGFSILDKSYKLFNWGSLTNSNNSSETYDKKVLSEISKFVREDIMKMKLDEVIESLNLNVKNKIDWEWKSEY